MWGSKQRGLYIFDNDDDDGEGKDKLPGYSIHRSG